MAFSAEDVLKEYDRRRRMEALLLSLYYPNDRKLLDYKEWSPPRVQVECPKAPVEWNNPPSEKGLIVGHFSGIKYKGEKAQASEVDVNKMCCWVSKFKDAMRRYQGIQTCKIPGKVLSDLDAKIKAYNLTVEGVEGFVRYSRVTKQHVAAFLKELRHSKQYENVNLIHYILTDKRVDIQHLEKDLVKDFKALVESAHRMRQGHMINVKYILYQLLKKHGHGPDGPDILTVKTGSKGVLYDDSFRKIYTDLGWKFTPL
ncbi:replicating factor [Tadpole virus 2]|uniref:Putative transcription factor 001R n=2 Tax=Frog virus 3 TaxID=10493 RepID=001R_FRG3G|nr:putative replicating factor [Frog virus 3]Q6GZX4.1 RecName: Full=Putative transcription factor 001R [Frog virus 3 (isolate Goorha)]QYJ57746.1 replicating factor [Stickleback virus]QYJ57841.1 replicating factor [Tadpole virus 2]WBY51161.1 replicating factor [Terrapene mexicana triunguis ranavirus 2]AAT09660.1 putative replicating factor [Frog virus 3]AIX94573.1 putative replicating factor [Frog virus 3]